MRTIKNLLAKTVSVPLFIITLPGTALFKAVNILYRWNLPEILSIVSMILCVVFGYQEYKVSNDPMGIIMKYFLLFSIVVLFVLPFIRLALVLLSDISEPFFNINLKCKKRLSRKVSATEKTLNDYIEEMKSVSPYGMVTKLR